MPRQKRKRKRGAPAPRRPPAPKRREQRAERAAVAERERRASQRTLGTVGERPPGPFGGLPVSEIAIFAGLIGLIVGLIQGGIVIIVGIAVCALGVLEITAREHFSGFRSHTMLLAAVPAVGLEIVLVGTVAPRQRALLLVAVVPVFAACFWFLRRRFQVARQARLARPPAP